MSICQLFIRLKLTAPHAEVVAVATESCVYLLPCGSRGECYAQGGVTGAKRCSGPKPVNDRWNPERGKGQPKINPHRTAHLGPVHMQHQKRKQCSFYYGIVWQNLNHVWSERCQIRSDKCLYVYTYYSQSNTYYNLILDNIPWLPKLPCSYI